MTAEEVVQLLRTDPETLMRRVSLKIFGSRRAISTTYEFIVVDPQRTMPGFTTGFSGLRGKTKDRPVFHIKLARSSPHDVAAVPPGARFMGTYIAMKQVADGPHATHHMLPARGGPDIMVTCQLSGCTFGIGSDARGNRLVSHIQPPQAVKNLALRRGALSTATARGFAKDQSFSKFERENDYTYEAAIVGVRRDGKWHLYAQHIDPHGSGTAIARVTRLL